MTFHSINRNEMPDRYLRHVREWGQELLGSAGIGDGAHARDVESFCTDLLIETESTRVVTQVIGIGDCFWLAGRSVHEWQRWYAMAAWGFHLVEEPEYARIFGALAGEWEFLDRVASREPTTWGRVDVRSFEVMLGLSSIQRLGVLDKTLIQLSTEGYYDLSRDQQLALLAQSEQDRADERSRRMLRDLAEDWLADQGTLPRDARVHPGWDWVLSAIVGLMARRGMGSEGFSEEMLGYLGPGMHATRGPQTLPELV